MTSTQQPTFAGVDFENTSPADLAKMIADMTALKNKAEHELKAAQEKAEKEAVQAVAEYLVTHTPYMDFGKATESQKGDGIWAGYKFTKNPLVEIGGETYTVNVSLTHIRAKKANEAAKAAREAVKLES